MPDITDQFREAIRAAGLVPPEEIIADRKVHRFCNGKRGDDAGWYVLSEKQIQEILRQGRLSDA